MSHCTIYLASDSLSFLEPESITRLAASHFADHDYDIVKFANVKTAEKAQEIVMLAGQNAPALLVFSTVLIEVRDTFILKSLEQQVECIDLLSPLVKSLGKILKTVPVYQLNYAWKLNDEYFRRIHAIEFAINNDDGKSLSAFQKADVVLIGVSRTSKTPLSIYLSYHSYLVVNIPLVAQGHVPKHLFEISSKKVIGLTIHPTRLNHIRSERNIAMGVEADSGYSDLGHIIDELEFAESVMKRIGCPIIDVSNNAVEETAEQIMKLIKKPIK